jgi:hypothetical protein
MNEDSTLEMRNLAESLESSSLLISTSISVMIEALSRHGENLHCQFSSVPYVPYGQDEFKDLLDILDKAIDNSKNKSKAFVFPLTIPFHNNNINIYKENKIRWDDIFYSISRRSLEILLMDIPRQSKHEMVKSYLVELALKWGFVGEPEYYPDHKRYLRVDCVWTLDGNPIAGFEIDKIIAKKSIEKLNYLPDNAKKIIISIGTSRDRISNMASFLPENFTHIFPHKDTEIPRRKSRTPLTEIPENINSFYETGLLPDGFEEYARGKGIKSNLVMIFHDFVLYHRKKGSKFRDWNAAWQTWVRNQIKFHPECRHVAGIYSNSKMLTKETMGDLLEN